MTAPTSWLALADGLLALVGQRRLTLNPSGQQ